MALILNIETSTEVCSIALARDGVAIQRRETLMGQNHAMLVTVFINEVLAESNTTIDQLDRCGSFRRTRIVYRIKDRGICCKRDLLCCTFTSDCHHFTRSHGLSCH